MTLKYSPPSVAAAAHEAAAVRAIKCQYKGVVEKLSLIIMYLAMFASGSAPLLCGCFPCGREV